MQLYHSEQSEESTITKTETVVNHQLCVYLSIDSSKLLSNLSE